MSHRARVVLFTFVALAALLSGVVPVAQPMAAAAVLRLSATQVASGDGIQVTGSGFHAGDTAVVSATFTVQRGSQRAAVAAAVNNAGSFATNLAIPAGTAPGRYPLIAKDFHGNQVTQEVTVLPVVDARAGSTTGTLPVATDSAFYIRGTGFFTHEPISVSMTFPLYDGSAVVMNRSIRSTDTGRFGSVLLRVPHGARQGRITAVVSGNVSKRSARVPVFVSYHPSLALAPSNVRPGATFGVYGRGFVPRSRVRSAVTIPRANGVRETLARDAATDAAGAFSTSLGLPSDARPGVYTVSATDLRGGFQAFARVRVSVHPLLVLQPTTAVPGQTVSASGTGFGAGVGVTLSARFPLTGGGSRIVSSALVTQGGGSFSGALAVPQDAATADVTVLAHASNGEARARLAVRVPPTPTPSPTPTATPLPPTSTPVPPKPRSRAFRFQYVSLWYHPVREGAYDHLVVQGQPHRFLGIWVHITFPNGQRLALYQTTNRHGFWQTDFQIPRHAVTRQSDQAVITLRLWKGHRLRKTFVEFTVLR
ncbi:MAG: hypothetical protein NVS2B16_18880 [Chloroflexota bacterium]